MRGVLGLAGTIITLMIAAQLSSASAELIVEQVIRPAVYQTVTVRIEELCLQDLFLSPLEELEQVIDAIGNDFVRKEARKLLTAMALEFPDQLAQDTLRSLSGEVIDTVLYGPVQRIIYAVVHLMCFGVISAALRPVIWTAGRVFTLPILKQADRLGGLVLGGIKALILIFLGVWALRTFGLWITEETMAQSRMLSLIAGILDIPGTVRPAL